jgi:hypothetical protein
MRARADVLVVQGRVGQRLRRRLARAGVNALTRSVDPRGAPSREVEWRTRILGVTASATVAVLFAAEFARVWRLGSLPLARGDEATGPARKVVRVIREGYRVSSTRENAIVNMVASFTVTLAITRGITYSIRTYGRLGPIRNMQTSGGRHIHHFVPGIFLASLAGGASIAARRHTLDRWLAIPFGVGVALVVDETALLLELEDVYWSEKGVVSLQVAFSVVSLLAALAYAIRVLGRGKPSLEADWERAAAAFDDLEMLSRANRQSS